MPHERYEKLAVWQRSIELVESVYQLTRDFPSDEKSGLAATLRRTVTGLPAKIAEADGQDETDKTIQSLKSARGVIREMQTYAVICRRLGFLSFLSYRSLRRKLYKINRTLGAKIEQIESYDEAEEPMPRLAA